VKRFQLAYENKKRPIGWWEPNKEATGLIQSYLKALGYNLAKSVKVEESPDGVTFEPDGIFGPETYDAVK
jgi:peptidoglycan hydrolase-like protein with peptidoglycan-binding domain